MIKNASTNVQDYLFMNKSPTKDGHINCIIGLIKIKKNPMIQMVFLI